eukprot:1924079-Pyramimonas_sp.AAC.1
MCIRDRTRLWHWILRMKKWRAWQKVKAKRPHVRPKSRRAGVKPDKTRPVHLKGAQQQAQPRA